MMHRNPEPCTNAVRRLRPDYRRCFVLRYVEERSYDEIADIMNVPVSTVGTYLHRARAQLKRMLEPAD
jgi:RNA polymerase sigma-70 factor (ECF subfamily)